MLLERRNFWSLCTVRPHIQPRGFEAWDYGENLTAGQTMEERRRVLAALAPLYLLLEGGLGAEQEARLALRLGALLIPVGFTGGAARALFEELSILGADTLPRQQRQAWMALGNYQKNPEEIAMAIATLIQGAMLTKGHLLNPTPKGVVPKKTLVNFIKI